MSPSVTRSSISAQCLLPTFAIATGAASCSNACARRPAAATSRRNSRELFECVRAAAGSGDKPSKQAALILVLAVQHLENLRRLEARLGERANAARQTARSRGTPLLRHAAA